MSSAKRPDTRARRAVEALRALGSPSTFALDDETEEGVTFLDPDLADEDPLSQ